MLVKRGLWTGTSSSTDDIDVVLLLKAAWVGGEYCIGEKDIGVGSLLVVDGIDCGGEVATGACVCARGEVDKSMTPSLSMVLRTSLAIVNCATGMGDVAV